MWVYRIGKTKYAQDLKGTGAKLYGGRWNTVGTPCIYTSESRALAVLEYTVNVTIDFIPSGLSICIFQIDENQIYTVDRGGLPRNWRDAPAPLSTKSYGTELLSKGHSIVKVPSVVIPDEYNYILNPLSDKSDFKLIEVKGFAFDSRIKG